MAGIVSYDTAELYRAGLMISILPSLKQLTGKHPLTTVF
jgi:hypothetical protein